MTGGIASGKTAASNLFANLGVPVVDTDIIAREVVEPGQAALKQITESFGPEVLDSDGALDRRRMRQIIFSSPEAKSRLEAILHPVIAREVLHRLGKITGPYCILVIPLYTESSAYQWVDRVLVVDVSEEVQMMRVMARDGIEREQAQAILNAQAGRSERLALADDVLDNSGGLPELRKQVETLHESYLSAAAEKH